MNLKNTHTYTFFSYMQKTKKKGPKAEEGGFTCDVGGIKEDVRE